MGKVVVRYKVKPERADENQELVERVFSQLESEAPDGIRYATFRLDDGVTFVHVASIETGDGTNPLQAVAAFQEFASALGERCDEPPLALDATVVGAYRFFAD